MPESREAGWEREWRGFLEQEELAQIRRQAAHTFTGLSVFLEREEMELVRRALLEVRLDDAYELVDAFARVHGLPARHGGHYGVHLETGELLEP